MIWNNYDILHKRSILTDYSLFVLYTTLLTIINTATTCYFYYSFEEKTLCEMIEYGFQTLNFACLSAECDRVSPLRKDQIKTFNFIILLQVKCVDFFVHKVHICTDKSFISLRRIVII